MTASFKDLACMSHQSVVARRQEAAPGLQASAMAMTKTQLHSAGNGADIHRSAPSGKKAGTFEHITGAAFGLDAVYFIMQFFGLVDW